jgi:LAGLIDADG DNA endonuclease family
MSDLVLKRYVLKTLKLEGYKRDYKLKTKLPKYLHETIIGVLLSDGGVERSSSSSNVRMNVVMSAKNYPYIFHLYNLFEPYINNDLYALDVTISKNLNRSKNYSTLRFKTISMPQLVYYYNIFYKKDISKSKIVKRVPIELKDNFSCISLAHLLMGDGNYMKDRNIIRIYTNSFVKKDVLFLSSILDENFFIKSKIVHDRNNQYIIHIKDDNVDRIRNIVLPFVHPSMYYKLGINEKNYDVNKFDYFKIIDYI